MNEPDDEGEHTAQRGAVIAFGIVVVLVLGGLWLWHVLGGAADVQDCVSSGRTNCAPVHPAN